MRRFVIGILLLLLSVWIGLKIAEDPGQAIFLYRDWSVQLPLWLFFIGVLLLILIIYFVMKIVEGVDVSILRWRHWLRWRRREKAQAKTNRGLIELIKGRWYKAEKFLTQSIDLTSSPLINYLSAAKAAHAEQQYEKRDVYLRQAEQLNTKSESAIGLVKAEMEMEQGQYESALGTLSRLQHKIPYNKKLLKLLERVYIHLGDWQCLIKLIPSLRKAKVFNPNDLDKLELHVYEQMLIKQGTDADKVIILWQNFPKAFKKKPSLLSLYVEKLINNPKCVDDLENLLAKNLKQDFDPKLMELYGLLVSNNPKKQLAQAEQWEKKYPLAITYLTLGRLAIRTQLWGKAKVYFEEALALENNPQTQSCYASLLDQIGEFDLAKQHYREGLRLALHRN